MSEFTYQLTHRIFWAEPVKKTTLYQAMSSTKRLLVYTVPVTMIAFALNIPKFFEVKLNEYNGTEVVNEEESRREPTFVFW